MSIEKRPLSKKQMSDTDIGKHAAESFHESKQLRSLNSKPRPLEIAKAVLGDDVQMTMTSFELKRLGRYVAVNFEDVMKETNRRLAMNGQPQVTTHPKWEWRA